MQGSGPCLCHCMQLSYGDISLKFFHVQQVLITLIFSPELLIKPLNLHIVLKPLIDILSVKELTVQC